MPRELKPQSIGFYEDDRTHTTVEMFLNRNDHTFFAKFGGDTYYGASKNELVERLRTAVREAQDIQWSPVIEVRRLSPANYTYLDGLDKDPSFVGFRLYRYYYGRLVDGTWVTTRWETAESQRVNSHQNLGWGRDKEFIPPCHRQGHSGIPDTYYLPYEEATWAALSQLVENIRAVRRKLEEMLSSEEGMSQLVKAITAGMGAKMLGTGEDNANQE
jgi:hypothetical protein